MKPFRWLLQKARWYWFLLKWQVVHGRRQRARWREWNARFKGAPPYTRDQLRALIVEVNRKDNE